MGVRGAGRLLSLEPRRFGCPWALKRSSTDEDEARESTVIYIDSPALMYYLLAHYSPQQARTPFSPCKIPPLPFTPSLTLSSGASSPCVSLFGVLEPWVLGELSVAFIQALADAGAREVWLVMEGLASNTKIEQQVERMKKRADYCSTAARNIAKHGFGSCGCRAWKKVPHLFAEEAMAEAVERYCYQHKTGSVNGIAEGGQSCDVYVHYANGEAEQEIAVLMEKRSLDCVEDENKTMSLVAMSNDTDLLIYNTCPGYVPLESLEFSFLASGARNAVNDVANEINNLHRVGKTIAPLRCNCVRGWFYSRDKFAAGLSIPSNRLACLAALAGCDYSPPSAKLQKRLTASRRNVVASNTGGLRTRERKNPSMKSCLLACGRFIARHARDGKKGKAPMILTEGQKHEWMSWLAWAACGEGKGKEERYQELLQIFQYIHGIYTLESSVEKSSLKRRTQPLLCIGVTTALDAQARRLVEHRVLYCQPVVELIHVDSSKRKQRKVVSSLSAWIYPQMVEMRRRLYTLLSVAANDLEFTVKEYCHGNPNKIKEMRTSTVSSTGIQGLDEVIEVCARPSDMTIAIAFEVMEYCLCGTTGKHDFNAQLTALPSEQHFLFLVSLLLPRRAVLLLAVINGALDLNLHHRVKPHREEQDTDLLRTIALIQVAYFHVALLAQLLLFAHVIVPPYSKIICDRCALLSWHEISLSDNLQSWNEIVNHVFERSFVGIVDNNSYQQWQSSVVRFGKAWEICRDMNDALAVLS